MKLHGQCNFYKSCPEANWLVYVLSSTSDRQYSLGMVSTPFEKSTSIVQVVSLSGRNLGLLRNCYKAKSVRHISPSDWGVG